LNFPSLAHTSSSPLPSPASPASSASPAPFTHLVRLTCPLYAPRPPVTLGMALHDPSTPEWSIYMPMAKSLVRALDATQLAARELLPHVPVEGFVSVGRVVAFISYGYDLINFQPNMQHLLDSLGAVPILGRFYVDYNLTRFLHTPQLRHILSYTDPYFFRKRLTMPKLLIAASNDEFFLMDDSYFYYNGLPPPTLLKFVANVDHMVIQKSYWVRPYPPTLICLSGYARP
ncbi:unnamed protein product, partial [Closterium sp. NIES-65]